MTPIYSMHAAMCLCAQTHISAKLGQIREIKVSMESEEHAGPLGAQSLTQTQACVHVIYVLACLGPYLSQIGLDQKDKGIYGIRRTYRTYLST